VEKLRKVNDKSYTKTPHSDEIGTIEILEQELAEK